MAGKRAANIRAGISPRKGKENAYAQKVAGDVDAAFARMRQEERARQERLRNSQSNQS